MKLKKIASLMLAGIMAVSMLTACGTSTADDTQKPDQSEEPVVADVVSAVEKGIKAHNSDLEINVTTSQNLDAAIDKLFADESNYKINDHVIFNTMNMVFATHFDGANYNMDFTTSNFISNPDSLDWMNHAYGEPDGNRTYFDGDHTYVYAIIPVTNNAFDTLAGEEIGKALAGLENIIPANGWDDHESGALNYKNLNVDYTMYVTTEDATLANNSVVTYVMCVMRADFSARV